MRAESHSYANASRTQESQRSPLTEARSPEESSPWSCHARRKKMKTDDYAWQPCRAGGDDLSQL